jgi:biotin transport system ATP-binding protein
MRHLNGLARPSSGDVRLRGESIFENLSLTRRSVGLVFQDADAQIVGQTVERDVAFGPENLKLSRSVIHRRVSEALQATGLVGFNQRRPHSLSGGEKRRLAVAGVLAMKPDILVLDEPFTGLDWPGCADLIEVLETLHGGGTGIILITHDLDKILGHADRLLLMNGGRIAADGTPQEIIGVVESLGIRRPSGSISTMTWKRKPPHA